MNLDPEKLIALFVIALLVLGPNRLPQAARTLGKGLAEVRKYTSAFRAEVDQALAEPRRIVDAAVHEVEMQTQLERSSSARATSDLPSPLGLPDGASGPGPATSEQVPAPPFGPAPDQPDDPTWN